MTAGIDVGSTIVVLGVVIGAALAVFFGAIVLYWMLR